MSNYFANKKTVVYNSLVSVLKWCYFIYIMYDLTKKEALRKPNSNRLLIRLKNLFMFFLVCLYSCLCFSRFSYYISRI